MKLSLLTLSCLPFTISALKLPVHKPKRDTSNTTPSGTSKGHIIGLVDALDSSYIVNVTVSGQSYPVQLDTGSSDLWISAANTNVQGNQSNLQSNITYGSGYAYGNITTGPVYFAGFEIPSQAYLIAQQAENPVLESGAVGILGVSFASLSKIDQAVSHTGGSWGRSLLSNIFAQNPGEPNFMAVSLQRDAYPGQNTQGSFAIGEYAPEYANVANTSHIPTFPENSTTQWTVLVDQVVANGQKLDLKSQIVNAPPTKAVALLDSGTSEAYAPRDVVASIYGTIPGATFNESTSKWDLPCDQEVDVSIVIGGRLFNIHPLDASQQMDSGEPTCMGSWQIAQATFGQLGYDFIFGDSVLRSLYTLFDFGSDNQTADPFVQLLSLVNGSDASAEFHQLRGGTISNTFPADEDFNPTSSPNGIDWMRRL